MLAGRRPHYSACDSKNGFLTSSVKVAGAAMTVACRPASCALECVYVLKSHWPEVKKKDTRLSDGNSSE
jgi:hypothetical protein